MARFSHEIRPWIGVTQGYYVDKWEEGYLLQTFTVTPDQYYAALSVRVGPEAMAIMADLKHFASAGALVHDEDSEGWVRNTPAGADLYYNLGDGDRRRLIDGMQLTAEVFFAAGATEVFTGIRDGGMCPSPRDIEAYFPYDTPAARLFTYASHPMGTCRMGGDPNQSVIDPDGRVWGWKNLHVADASAFPSSLGVNPQVTAMAMGLVIGERILAT